MTSAYQAIADIQTSKGVVPMREIAAKYGVSYSCVQYWQKIGRPPLPPGTSASAIQRQKKRALENRATT